MKLKSVFSLFVLFTVCGPVLLPQLNRDPGLFRGPKKDKNEDENVRSVQGVVTDDKDRIVEGAVVQLKDTKTLRIRSFITQEQGQYRFHGLSTNIDYELKAEYQEASSPVKTLSVFDSRKQAVINLKLEPKE